VKKATLNPVFGEKFEFPIGSRPIQDEVLHLSVHSHDDKIDEDDCLGTVRIPLSGTCQSFMHAPICVRM
jgi:Ca2+-dependent lipid-binding protein